MAWESASSTSKECFVHGVRDELGKMLEGAKENGQPRIAGASMKGFCVKSTLTADMPSDVIDRGWQVWLRDATWELSCWHLCKRGEGGVKGIGAA
jgi:hypothetical protein